MKQFNLDTWLQDKNRKICTRDGREVTIGKTDIHIHGMSHMILGKYGDIYEIWHSNGRINYTGSDCNLDLFFADDELTEFEEELIKTVLKYKYWNNSKDEVKQCIKKDSKLLLDLARKELEPELGKKLKEVYNQGGLDTQEEITKCLPKWKKAKKDEELDCHVAIQQDDRVVLSDFVQKDEYYITLDVLKTLPKEE